MSANEVNYMEGVIGRMKVIQRIFPPSARHVGAGSRQQALDGHGSPGAAATLLLRKHLTITFLVIIAALAVALFLMPGGLIQAQQDDMTMVSFAENGEDAVATFTATDPEGAMPITWSLATDDNIDGVEAADIADGADHFTIGQDGVLKFSNPPDFEAPSGEDAATNNYKVVVLASDAATGGMMGYHKVTVMVTDVEEMGEVTWTVDPDGDGTLVPTGVNGGMPIMQFQVGATLTATATDGDIEGATKTVVGTHADVAADPTWRWYRSPSKTATGTMIDGATSNTYSATTADVGMYLRVVAYYLIVGNVDQETASLTADYPVLAARLGDSELEFSPSTVSREVSEGDKGMNVGAPVVATGNHGAVNYILTGTDSDQFEIDPKTGQITTSVDLNYEGTAAEADQCDTLNDCEVTVTATDASGQGTTTTPATVGIDIKNVDEKPTFPAAALTVIEVPENSENGVLFGADTAGYTAPNADAVTYTVTDPETRSLTYRLMGPDGAKFQLSDSQVLSFREAPDYEEPTDANMDNAYMVTVRASDGTMYADRMVRVTVIQADDAPEITEVNSPIRYTENGESSVVTFMATEQDGDTVTWSVADGGTGAVDFEIDADDGVLEFLNPPDYDVPTGGDTDDSNTYVVTVTASSTGTTGTPQTDMFNLTVMVTNLAETGKVTWTVDPDGAGTLDATTVNGGMPITQFQVGALLTATASDGDITSTTTQSFTVDIPNEVTGVTWQWYRGGSRITGSDAEDNTYTVTTADVGSRLRAMVTYTVQGNTNRENASLTADYPVLAARLGDSELEFSPSTVSREVSEGDKGMNVGAPVVATGNHGAVNYILTGTDSDQFEIDPKTGQITTSVDLNYEGTAAEADQCDTLNDCEVTVTATDASGQGTTTTPATVGIDIKNVDEKPTFVTETNAMSPTAITRTENMTALADAGSEANVTYRATDPEGLNVNLELVGADRDKFSLSSVGVLSFKTAPDYEEPTDANGDNVYEVTVRASDGTLNEDRMVRVTVMDANEPPEIMSGVTEEEMTLLDRYDSNEDDVLQLEEVFKAIDDYFDYPDRITLEEVYEIVDMYFDQDV